LNYYPLLYSPLVISLQLNQFSFIWWFVFIRQKRKIFYNPTKCYKTLMKAFEFVSFFSSTFVSQLHWALETSWPTYDTHCVLMASKRASRTHLCCLDDVKTWRTSRNNWPIWGKLKYDCTGCLFVNNNSSNCL
jgi:hypothetical protein